MYVYIYHFIYVCMFIYKMIYKYECVHTYVCLYISFYIYIYIQRKRNGFNAIYVKHPEQKNKSKRNENKMNYCSK